MKTMNTYTSNNTIDWTHYDYTADWEMRAHTHAPVRQLQSQEATNERGIAFVDNNEKELL